MVALRNHLRADEDRVFPRAELFQHTFVPLFSRRCVRVHPEDPHTGEKRCKIELYPLGSRAGEVQLVPPHCSQRDTALLLYPQ